MYAPNHLPTFPLDVMVYLNDTPPNPAWAKKHVLYMQNAYMEGSETALKQFHQWGYDGYAFISNRLLGIHRRMGKSGIYLPFGVDTDHFHPRPKRPEFEFDVAYIGNDIKGEHRSNLFLLPAAEFHFGLFGNWKIVRHRFKFWKNWFLPLYRTLFEKLSRGRIAQDDVPALYSSARVNINCTAQDCVDWDVITLRTFEILACRGFLISDKVPLAETELAGGVVFTDGGDDLRDKIRHYLAHPAEREAIAAKGFAYVLEHATIRKRMADLSAYLLELA